LYAQDLAARLNKDFHCAPSSSSATHTAFAAQRKPASPSSSSKKSTVGSCYRAAYFQPTWSKYNHTVVPGVQWFPWRSVQQAAALLASTTTATTTATASPSNINNTTSMSPFVQGVQILCAMRDLSVPADAFQWDGSWFGHDGTELIDFYAGTPTLRNMIDSGLQSEDIVKVYEKDVALFRHQRQQYLLY